MQLISLPALLMGILALICLLFVLWGLKLALKRTPWPPEQRQAWMGRAVALVTVWVLLVSGLALTGFFTAETLPPRAPLFVLLGVGLIGWLCFRPSFRPFLLATPLHWPVLLQSFRIVVELLLLLSFRRGLIPEQMTWEGYNLDVLSGLLALPAALLMWKRPALARPVGILFNLVGLLLLVTVVTIAVLSMPTPFRYFTNEPGLMVIGTFPFIFLPTVLVVLAAGLHLFSLRQLLMQKR